MEEIFSIATVVAAISSVVGFLISAGISKKKDMEISRIENKLQSIEKTEFLSQATSSLIESIEKHDQAVIQVGSMLIIKTDVDDEERIITLALDPEQVAYLEAHHSLFQKPKELIERIQNLGGIEKRQTPAKIVNLE